MPLALFRVALFLALSTPALAQQAESVVKVEATATAERPRSGWAALPIGTYAPETSLGLGAFATHFFRFGNEPVATRPSSVSLVGLYTLKEQLIVELIPELYWHEETWHVWTRVDYRRYPNTLWAQGNRASIDTQERYAEDRLRWQALADRALFGALRVEGKLEAIYMRLSDVRPGGLLDRDELPGANGGRAVGLGGGVLWDSRDHMLTPHEGDLHELALMSYGDLVGSEHDFSTVLLDLRRYIPITKSHTLALEFLSELQAGRVPFFKLATLGGEDRLRGLFEGRFRDKAMWCAQAEYRLPIVWRLSGILHSGVGQVARSAAEFGFAPPEWSMGVGGRLMLNTDERLNLRADFGVSREGYGIYVGIGEAY
jgi:hypothetical protein